MTLHNEIECAKMRLIYASSTMREGAKLTFEIPHVSDEEFEAYAEKKKLRVTEHCNALYRTCEIVEKRFTITLSTL